MSSEEPTVNGRSRSASLFWLLALNLLLAATALFLFQKRARENAALSEGQPAVIARVNGAPIYRRDLLSAVKISGKDPEIGELRAGLKQMILAKIVEQKSEKEIVDPAETDALWKTLRHQFSDQAELSAALQKAGLTEKAVRQRLETSLRCERWLRKHSQVEPSEADLLAWQTAHPEVFTLPEAVTATHFAAIFPPRGTPEDFLARGDLIRAAQARLREGVPFAEIIETDSEDPSKKTTHGSLGWFTKTRMNPDLANAAFSLPAGTISPPVQTRFGFHLLQVSEHRPEKTGPPSDLRERVRDELQLKKLHALLADLAKDARLQILAPAFTTPLYE